MQVCTYAVTASVDLEIGSFGRNVAVLVVVVESPKMFGLGAAGCGSWGCPIVRMSGVSGAGRLVDLVGVLGWSSAVAGGTGSSGRASA